MNSAQLYKEAFRRKRTYFVSCCLAVALFVGLGALGIHEGYVFEVEEEEEKVLSNVPYAESFMRYAPEIGWDWELLAAVAFHESHYNPNAKSKSGARGIMQIMPKACLRAGLNDSTVFCADDNIAAATQVFGRLQNQFRFVPDSAENVKFVLAAYNAGPAHILDARRLVKKYGGNQNRWEDTEKYLLNLKFEEFYTDSVVQFGAFSGEETSRYVGRVIRTYKRIKTEEAKLRDEAN